MKSYIIILLIAFISCSKFIQKQKRIGDINLKSKYSIIQDEINKIIKNFFNFCQETLKSFIYLADNANFDKILNDLKELNKNTENFLKVYSYDNLFEREKKIQNQLKTIRLNSHTIMNYIKENKFSDEIAKKIKQMTDNKTVLSIFHIELILKDIKPLKERLSNQKEYETILNNLKKDAKDTPNSIKNLIPLLKKDLINYFTNLYGDLDKSMPDFIKNLKETFPKIQAIFHNKKKIEEFKQKFKTFFIFKNIASVEDFDIVIKAYQILIENFYKVFKFAKFYKYSFFPNTQSLNDFNIFIHGIKDRKYFSEYYINLIEKIFTTYNINDLIVDLKEAMNSLKNIVKRIEKDELVIYNLIEKLKEKVDKMKEENLLTLCKGYLDYFKLIITH